jgi:hypothetical protein
MNVIVPVKVWMKGLGVSYLRGLGEGGSNVWGGGAAATHSTEQAPLLSRSVGSEKPGLLSADVLAALRTWEGVKGG